MSHDGATAGNDAAVTRSDYGRRRPDPPSSADHPRGESEYRRESRYFEGLGAATAVWSGRHPRRASPHPDAPDFDRADRIGEFWSYPESRNFAELLIDCGEDRTSGPCWSACCERPVA